MDKRAGPLAEISLETGEISPTGMKIFPYKHSQAGWPACRDNFGASAHAFVASRVYVKMAELSEVREVSTAAKKADCTFDANNFAFVTKSCKPFLLAASNVFSTLK